ncbi:MAG: Ig-like domain-containing protein, partial [Chitinophagales bacterium]
MQAPQQILFQGGTNDIQVGTSQQSASSATTTMVWNWTGNQNQVYATIGGTIDGSSNLASFTLSPALCSNLTIPTGQTVSASVRFRVTSGTMPSGTVRSNAVISSGGTTIFNGTTATVTFTTGSGGVGSTGTLTWTGTTTAAHNLIIGQTIRLDVSNENSAVQYRLLYDSQNAPSFISIPTSASTSIQVTSFDVYDAAYNGGSITLIEPLSTTVYPRATVSTQFGYEDITGLDFKLNSTLTVPGVQVAASGCTKTYEYAWTPTVGGDYNMVATAREGLEGTVTDIDSSFVAICPLTVTGTITTSPSCTTPTGGVVEISTLNAVGPYSYNWVNTTNSTLGSGTLSPSTLSGLAAGTYLITVSNSNMCSGTTSFTLTQTIPFSYTSSVSQILCNNAANGAIDITVTSGSPTFTWSDGATTLDRSGLSPGTYSITLTQSGCSATESFTISQPANPLLVPRTSTDPTCALNDGSIDLSPSGGTTPYTYVWSNNLVAPDLYYLVAGTYTVTVTDANGCTSSTATTLTLPTCQSAPVAVDDLFQFTNDMTSTGSVRTNDTDSDTPLANLVYTLVTSPSSSQGTLTMEMDGDITFVPAAGFVGIFTVQYKVCDDQSLCDFGDLTLDIAPPLYMPVCATDFSDAYSVTPDPMVDTYEWSIPEGIGAVFVSGQNTPSIIINWTGVTETAYGNICVKTINVCGESSTICFPVKVKRVEPAANNAEGCLGDDVSLYATAVDGSSYSWSGPNGFSSNLQSPTIYNVTLASSGTYTVTVTDKDGCTGTKAINVTIYSTPTASAIGTPAPCGAPGGTVDVTVNGGTAAYTYYWSSGHITEDLTTLFAGNYTVTVTDQNGCTDVQVASISNTTAPTLALSGTNNTCNGGISGAITSSASGGTPGYSYAWSTGASTANLSGLSDGYYYLTLTDAANCKALASLEITEPDALQLGVNATNSSCHGANDGTITLTVSGGTTPYSFLWNDGTTTQNRPGLDGGVYSVTVSGTGSCTLVYSVTIAEPQQLTASITVTNNPCFGDSEGILDLSVTGGTSPYSYDWSTTATTQDLINMAASASPFTVTVTDGNGCTTTTSASLSTPADLQLSANTLDLDCYGVLEGSIELLPTGGTGNKSYLWSNGVTTKDLADLAAGSYTVVVTDGNGCTKSASYTITSPDELLITDNITDLVCFNIPTGGIALSITGGTAPLQFNWSNSSTTQDLTTLSAGEYSLTITDNNGCTKETGPYVVQEPEELVIAGAITPVACNGEMTGEINISVTGGTGSITYSWASGSTLEDLTGLSSGTYSLTVTDGSLCQTTASFEVTEPDELTVAFTSTDVSCKGANNGSIVSVISGGVQPFTLNWSNGSSNHDIMGLVPATYTLTVTDNNMCTTVSAKIIAEPDELIVNSVYQNNLCAGASLGEITLSPQGGNGNFQYSWSNGSTASMLTGLTADTYTVTVTDSKSCTSVVPFTLTDPTRLEVNVTYTDVSCAAGLDGTIQLSVSGGVGPYTYLWNTAATDQNLSGLGSGNYEVTVQDQNNCTIGLSVSLMEPEELAATAVVTDNRCKDSGDGSINLTVTGGTLPYQFLWSSGETSEDISSLGDGTFAVTITDAEGCSKQYSFTVNEPIVLSATTSISSIDCYGDADGSITVNPSGGVGPFVYFWNNGASTNTISNLDGGTYVVTVTDANNCTYSISSEVLEPDQALSLTLINQEVSCFGLSNGSVIAGVLGGTTPYTYSWAGGESTSSITGLTAGTYTVTVEDAANCIISGSVVVTQPAAISISDTLVQPTCVNLSGGSIKVGVEGGVYPFKYTWQGRSDTTYNLVNLMGGSYTVTVTDFNSCTKSTTIQLNTPLCNLPPIAKNDTVTTKENAAVVICVPNNDTDPDNNLDLASVMVLMNPSHGTVSVNSTTGCITYTPANGYEGPDQFTYKICDTGIPVYCDTATVYITITPLLADLAISKSSTPATYVPGESVTWTLTVTNNGPENVIGALVNDDIDNALTNVSWTSSTMGTASVAASGTGDLVNEPVSIAAGAGNSVTFTITADVPSDYTGNLVNTATVAPPSGTTDPDPTNDSDTETDTPAPEADLEIVKSSTSATYTAGEGVTWTITVTNNGPSDVIDALVNDDIDNDLTNVSWTTMVTGTATTAN